MAVKTRKETKPESCPPVPSLPSVTVRGTQLKKIAFRGVYMTPQPKVDSHIFVGKNLKGKGDPKYLVLIRIFLKKDQQAV